MKRDFTVTSLGSVMIFNPLTRSARRAINLELGDYVMELPNGTIEVPNSFAIPMSERLTQEGFVL